MTKIVILISGRGSNMKAIIRTAKIENWPASIVAIISNRVDSLGIHFARQHGINTIVINNNDFSSREDFDTALCNIIDCFSPRIIVLAGFMHILTASFIQHYPNMILNIHPSLLPSFPGLATHKQALLAGVKLHGTTVHFVTTDLDNGPIIAQVAVPVLQNDNEYILEKRVLKKEHVIYPRVIRWFIEGKLSINNHHVYIDPTAKKITH